MPKSDKDMEALRQLLHSLDADQLHSLGVKMERPDPKNWVWLRDMMADSLHELGRYRAASALREFPFGGVHRTYSVGISADLLNDMAARIARRFDA